jgi:hypothetical protein
MSLVLSVVLLLFLFIPALMWWGSVLGPMVGPTAAGLIGVLATVGPAVVYLVVSGFVLWGFVIPFLDGWLGPRRKI